MRNFYIKIRNNKKLTITVGNYAGDVADAISAIQKFCNSNHVTLKNIQFGFSDLSINNVTHRLSQPGIDLQTMLGFCGADKVLNTDIPRKPQNSNAPLLSELSSLLGKANANSHKKDTIPEELFRIELT